MLGCGDNVFELLRRVFRAQLIMIASVSQMREALKGQI